MKLPFADKLQCPACGLPVRHDLSASMPWTCDSQHHFSETNGVPVMRTITEQAPLLPIGGDRFFDAQSVLAKEGIAASIRQLIGTNYVPYPAPPTRFIPSGARILNIGSGMCPPLTDQTVNLDCFLFPTVHIVADSQHIPFQDETFDAVVMEFCLEHMPAPWKTCQEACRVLRKGGVMYASYPFIHTAHAFPHDYFRFTPDGMNELMCGMRNTETGVLSGPACRWLGAIADFVSCLIPSEKAKFIARAMVLGVCFPIRYLDIFLNRHERAWQHAVTLYSVYQK